MRESTGNFDRWKKQRTMEDLSNRLKKFDELLREYTGKFEKAANDNIDWKNECVYIDFWNLVEEFGCEVVEWTTERLKRKIDNLEVDL